MRRTAGVLASALPLAAALWSCGPGEETRGCTVDCSNWFTGRIDVRYFGLTTRAQCVEKGRGLSCTAKWCDGDFCEIVN